MTVKINIPGGIGEVTAENAASEETLRDLVVAMEKAGLSEGKARKQEDAAIGQSTKTKQNNTRTVEENSKQIKQSSVATRAAFDQVVSSLKSVALTAANVTAKFITQAANIAEDPVKATAELASTAIDTVGNTTQGFAKLIPVIGDGVAAMTQVAQDLAKTANNMFAEQLQKNVKALQEYNKIGVGFAGGMTQMQTAANSAGLGILEFSKIVTTSRENLNFLGQSVGESSQLLSNGIKSTVDIMGKSGQNLRSEMFKMGYTYEEQGEVMASFMANMAASGKLRTMTDEQIARGTRDYAKNLKVISDFTGQDAKKLMDKARTESMRAGLINKLQGDQKTAFMTANSLLTQFGPRVQDALTQFLTLGTITDPAVQASEELRQLIITVGNSIKLGGEDIENVTNKAMSAARDGIEKSGQVAAIGTASISGVASGIVAEMSQMFNQILSSNIVFDPERIKKMNEATERQANGQDVLAAETAKLYDETKKFAVYLETVLNKNLPVYAESLSKLNEFTLEQLKKGMDALSGKERPETKRDLGFLEKYGKDIATTVGGAALAAVGVFGAVPTGGLSTASTVAGAAAMTHGLGNIYNKAVRGKEGYASGGIASGPKSGYTANLHGTEAIIPLEKDPKSYPNDVKAVLNKLSQTTQLNELVKILKALPKAAEPVAPGATTAVDEIIPVLNYTKESTEKNTKSIERQNFLLEQILDAMQKNNSISSDILAANM